MIARHFVETENEALALRWDRWTMAIFTIAYLGFVGAEILHAIYFH